MASNEKVPSEGEAIEGNAQSGTLSSDATLWQMKNKIKNLENELTEVRVEMQLLSEQVEQKTKEGSSSSSQDWDEVQSFMGNANIPQELRNLLEILGFDNLYSICELKSESALEFESYIQTIIPQMFEKSELSKFLGKMSPEKFRFLPGHKILIGKIGTAAAEVLKTKQQAKAKKSFLNRSGSNISEQNSVQANGQEYLKEVDKLETLTKQQLKKHNISFSYLKSVTLDSNMETAIIKCSCSKDISVKKCKNRWTNLFNFSRHCELMHTSSKKKSHDPKQKKISELVKASSNASLTEMEGSDIDSFLQSDSETNPVEVEVQIHASPNSSDDNVVTPIKRRKKTENCISDEDSISPAPLSPGNKSGIGCPSIHSISRLERRRRKLEQAATSVPKITNYFPVLNHHEIVANENQRLQNRLKICLEMIKSPKNDLTVPDNAPHFLKVLVCTANRNLLRKKGGQRYADDELKSFSDFLFVTGGRLNYSTLEANLKKCVPSIPTVERHMRISTGSIQEGEFRWGELNAKLQKNKEPKIVWIGEDATKAIDRVEYDPSSNLLVGLVLPLTENGIPRLRVFEATSASAIENILRTEEVAGSVYCIMAQSLSANSSPFCLMLAGTNGKFTHADVLRRWRWIVLEARKHGITILGFSSDGDEKLLKAMRLITFPSNTSNPPEWSDWFHANLNGVESVFAFQDFVHLLAKLKARFTKSSVLLPMGKFVASPSHLRILIKEKPKGLHGLTEGLLDLGDKMNYRSAEKICNAAVTDLLTECVPESQATVCYLKLMRDSNESFLDRSLLPLTRVELIWRCLFFLRLWRQWLLQAKYPVRDCFVTLNAYHCIEINAHTLILLLRYLRDNDLPTSMFAPWKCSSQMNESHFRTARALTSTLFTAVNFSVRDFLQRTKRIDLLNDVPVNIADNYTFPSNKRVMKAGREVHGQVAHFEKFPSDTLILAAVDKGRQDALAMANDLGMNIPSYAVNAFIDFSDMAFDGLLWTEEDAAARIDPNEEAALGESSSESQVEEDSLTLEEQDAEEDLCIVSSSSAGLRTFEGVDLHPASPFVAIADTEGRRAIVRKSSLVRSLTTGQSLLDKSASRSERVRAPIPGTGSTYSAHDAAARLHGGLPMRIPSVEETVDLGNWCAFKAGRGRDTAVGRVLAFKRLNPPQPYKATSVRVDSGRKIGVLCNWFTMRDDGELISDDRGRQDFVPISAYKCTLPRPLVQDGVLIYSLAVCSWIEKP